MSQRHKCFVAVDRALKRHNTRLVVNLLNQSDLYVATERIRNLRDGQQAKRVVASHCPFCGQKLERQETALT